MGKLEKAKTLMEDAKKSMDRFEESFDLMIEDLKHEFETDSETLKAVHEYQSYQVYLVHCSFRVILEFSKSFAALIKS